MSNSSIIKSLKEEISVFHHIVDITNQNISLNTMLQQISKSLCSTLKGDSCFIYLLEHQSNELVLQGTWPPHPYQIGKVKLNSGEGITGWVAEHKKPVSISKNAFQDHRFKFFNSLPEDKYSAFLSVPIALHGKPSGVINLMNKKSRKFNQAQIKLFTSVASQISGALEKTRLLQQSQKKASQIETILHLSKSIVSGSYLQEILQLIVTLTAQTMNSKICSLMLLDPKTNELRIAATQSLSEEYKKKPPLKVGQSTSGKALMERKPIAVSDVTKEAGYSYPQIAKKEGLVSMLAVPMMIKDRPIGVLNCYSSMPHSFTEEETHILLTIANQAAIAIENTRLLEESQASKEALETRKIIERAKGMLMKSKSMDEEEAFHFIQRQAMNLRRSMREIGEAILLSAGLKDK